MNEKNIAQAIGAIVLLCATVTTVVIIFSCWAYNNHKKRAIRKAKGLPPVAKTGKVVEMKLDIDWDVTDNIYHN